MRDEEYGYWLLRYKPGSKEVVVKKLWSSHPEVLPTQETAQVIMSARDTLRDAAYFDRHLARIEASIEPRLGARIADPDTTLDHRRRLRHTVLRRELEKLVARYSHGDPPAALRASFFRSAETTRGVPARTTEAERTTSGTSTPTSSRSGSSRSACCSRSLMRSSAWRSTCSGTRGATRCSIVW